MLLTSRTDEPRVAVFVAIVAVFVSRMALPSFTSTKRDNQSSGMVLSADLAIAVKRHRQATYRATTVPELGYGLPRRLTDRKTAGQIPAASIMRGRHSKRFNASEESPDRGGEAATYLPGRWEHLPRPRIRSKGVVAAKRASTHILARVSFGFGGARGGQPQVAEFQAQGLPRDAQ